MDLRDRSEAGEDERRPYGLRIITFFFCAASWRGGRNRGQAIGSLLWVGWVFVL